MTTVRYVEIFVLDPAGVVVVSLVLIGLAVAAVRR